MERAVIKLVPGVDSMEQRVYGVSASAGPKLTYGQLRHQIPVQMFSHIRTLHLDLTQTHLSKESSGIYPVLDSLTGLKQIQVTFSSQLDSGPPWSRKRQVEGWVMQMLGRIRLPVELEVKMQDNIFRSDSVRSYWHLRNKQDEKNKLRDQVVFGAWVEVVRQALAIDRSQGPSSVPIHERAELRDNMLVLSPGAYAHEWQAKAVFQQQAWLRCHGHEEEASGLGEGDD